MEDAKEEFRKASEDLKTKNGVIGTLGSRKIRAKQHMEWRLHLYNISVHEHVCTALTILPEGLATKIDGPCPEASFQLQTIFVARLSPGDATSFGFLSFQRLNREKALAKLVDEYVFETVPRAAPLVKTIPKQVLDELIRCNQTRQLEEFYRFVEQNSLLFETMGSTGVG